VWSEVFRGNIDEVRLRVTPQYSVGRVTANCAVGEAVRSIAADGSVTCAPAGSQRAFRYNVFDTFHENCCWNAGDDSSLFGGVNPSSWTDGFASAASMSPDAETLRTLFSKKVYPGKNVLVSSERWVDGSSTNGKVTVALLRINNSTGGAIDWTAFFYFTAFSGWSEQASIALNGQEVWGAYGDYYANASAAVTMSLPPNQTSTIIFVVPSSPPWNGGVHGDQYHRTTFLAFFNNSLDLPPGLAMVDDLDTANGDLWFPQPQF
jgi:hypothetical protein